MPISKEKQKLYPDNWPEIRARILKRADNRCENCGAENYKPNPETGPRVVLTIAHVNHNPRNNEDNNLRSWCPRCHLRHDAKHHAENARKTRDKKNGIIRLPFE